MKPSEEEEDADDAPELERTMQLEGVESPPTLFTDPVDRTVALEPTADDTQGVPSPPSSPFPAPGDASQVFANRFEVVQLLGEGGMGRVYQVRDRQIEGREVALKVLRPRFSKNARFRELFFQEIRAAQKFVSENVNQVRDTGQMDDGRLFLTMDLVDGESLQQLLKRESKLNTRHALEITRQMLLGLQSGHEQGFVHRDVKPSNVMLATRVSKTDENPYGVGVRLLDFGIAALAADIGEGAVSGTPMYMSPEQTQGQRLDPRSDLFSVGIVLFEMLSGSRPFEGTSLEEVSTSMLETQVAPKVKGLEHLKPSVQKLLRKALEKDREKRFQNASEFIESIERSKAYRLPTGVPTWVGGLLGLTTVAAVGECFVILNMIVESGKVRDDLEASKTEAVFAEKRNSEGIVADLRRQISDLTLQLGATGDEKIEVQTDEKFLAKEVAELNLRLKAETSARERLQAQFDESVRENKKLEAKVHEQQLATLPVAQAAKGLDLILEFIDGGHGASALDGYQQLEANRVFDRSDIGGKDFVEALAQAAAGLSRGHLEDARAHVESAVAKLPTFQIGSAGWIGFVSDDKPPGYDRMARVKEVLAATQASVDAQLAAVTNADLERVKGLIEGPPDQDPDPVIRHGERYGWTDFAPFFESLVAHFETCASGGGLNVEKLRANRVLERWGAYADAHRSVPGPDSTVNDSIRWFWYARKWYVDRNADFTADLAELHLGENAPDWRAVLALQYGIAAGFDGAMRRPRTYLDRQIKNQLTSWIVDSVSGVDKQDGTVWTVKRKILTERAGDLDLFEDTLRVSFKDGVLLGSDSARRLNVFDPNARVEFWKPMLDRPVAANRILPRQAEVDSFHERFADAPIACLVVEDPSTDTTLFVSPDLGLVRDERGGLSVLELVFAGK